VCSRECVCVCVCVCVCECVKRRPKASVQVVREIQFICLFICFVERSLSIKLVFFIGLFSCV